MTDAAHGVIANLFLNQRVISAAVEYWLRNHFELTLLRDVPHPESESFEDMAAHFITRVYEGVDDIVLVGQGSLAISSDSVEPRYIHYLNFIGPAQRDFTLALPVRYLITKRTEELAASLVAAYTENEEVWKSANHAATLGEHHLANFGVGGGAWWRLFSPLAYGLEIATRLLIGVRDTMPTSWYYGETGGTFLARALFNALLSRRCDSLFAKEEEAALVEVRQIFAQCLQTYSSRGAVARLTRAVACLLRARVTMFQVLASAYQDMAKRHNRRFCLDDTPSRPWQISQGKW